MMAPMDSDKNKRRVLSMKREASMMGSIEAVRWNDDSLLIR
jgi:hypothetical protein